MYQRQPGGDGVCWVDVTQCDPSALGGDLSREAAMARLHMRLPDGQLVSGAAAFTGMCPRRSNIEPPCRSNIEPGDGSRPRDGRLWISVGLWLVRSTSLDAMCCVRGGSRAGRSP
jgi:hypothetical protein